MYVRINGKNYTKINALSFAPQTDVTGSAIPIDEVFVSIKTEDEISVGQYMRLYDDRNNLWSRLWIVKADREDEPCVKIHAMSDIAVLDRVKMDAVFYSSKAVSEVLDEIFTITIEGSAGYEIDNSFESATISGFCPEQSARERLLWVCFVLNAYVVQSFDTKIKIKVLSQNVEKNIPVNKTKFKPTIVYGDYVSKVTLRAYTFTQGTPSVTDKWVTDGTNYYVITTQDYSLMNPNLPLGVPSNEVIIDNVYLVNSSNVSGILSYFAGLYFNRVSVDLEAINNFEYFPGEKVSAYADENVIITGYIADSVFSFGLQAVSAIRLVAVDETAGTRLIIIYNYGSTTIAMHKYSFPVGYTYSIENPYLDIVNTQGRIVYRPLSEYATGTIVSGRNTNTQQCDIALEFASEGAILHIISVSGVDWVTGSNEVVRIE